MKSMLEGLDLTKKPTALVHPVFEEAVNKMAGSDYADNLRKALEAALAVVDMGTRKVDVNLATHDPEGHLQALRDELGERMDMLETALAPFKKEPNNGLH